MRNVHTSCSVAKGKKIPLYYEKYIKLINKARAKNAYFVIFKAGITRTSAVCFKGQPHS
jgi:hypothetical protein